MFGRDRGFAERDAQRIHFGVIADFHGLKVIGIDRYHNIIGVNTNLRLSGTRL
jgi:hypothetical protein